MKLNGKQAQLCALILVWGVSPRLGAADCYPNPAGLVAWWPGDGSATDIAGTNHGVLQGGATASAAGIVGLAFSFDGTNAYVQIPDSPVLKPTNLTVEAWVRFTALDSAGTATVGHQYIVFKQNSRSANFEGYDLSKERVGSSDYFAFRASSASGQAAEVLSTSAVATGVWYHVAGVRGSNFLQIYVNGQLERQTTVTFAQDYGNYPLYFGSSGQPYWDRKFRGTLDEVSLYNRALASNEIAALYAAGSAGKCKGVTITTHPQSQTVRAGSNVTFTVAATGFGTLGYQWRLNGTNLAGASQPVLVISNVQPTHAGDYTAVVTNSLSVATSAIATLTVLVPPFITNPPQSQTVVVGANVSLTVNAGGTAPLSYQWRKDGAALVAQTNATLVINNVTTNDAGSFDVIVSNAVGSVTSAPPALLTVLVPPTILAGPQNQFVIQGQDVVFTVTATGTPPLAYQWRRNGIALTGKTNSTLALTSVTSADAGNYDVVVSNAAGSVTSTPPAVLMVNSPPVLPAQTNRTIAELTTLIVTNTAVDGDLPPNVLSYLLLAGPTNAGISTNGVITWTPTEAQGPSTNIFITVVTDNGVPPLSATNSFTVVVTEVNVAPVLPALGDRTVAEETTLVVTNTASDADVPPNQLTYQLVNPPTGANISSYGVITWTPTEAQGPSTNLLVTVVTDNGQPPLSATNSFKVIVAEVNRPPVLPAQSDRTVMELTTLVVTNAASDPDLPPNTLSYSLINSPAGATIGPNGVIVWTPGEGQGPSTNLITTVVTDNGVPPLSATNSFKVIVTSVNLAPFITNAPQSQVAVVGADVSFSVGAGGTRPLTYQWRKDGMALVGRTNFTLTLTKVTTNDAGGYVVVVSNVAGSVTSAPPAILTVLLPPPTILVPPENQTVGVGEAATFGVVASGAEPLSYLWLRDGAPIPGATNSVYTVAQAQLNDDGAGFSCVVSNTSGFTNSPIATLFVKVIPDLSLETAVRCALSKPDGPLTLADLEGLTCLSAAARGISNLAGLRWATNLERLCLNGNAITDLTPLQGLYRLGRLELEGNRIGDLSPLRFLTNLNCLAIGQNPVRDYSPLSNLANLTSLSVREGGLTDLEVLRPLTRLASLLLWQNGIEDISPLVGLTNLTYLDLRWNSITNCDSVGTRLVNLSSLFLGGNSLSNCPALHSLPRLTLLNLADNQISNVAPLAGLTNLSYLVLSRNPIPHYGPVGGLTNLVNLELSGNSISNLAFLSGLTRLSYVDLGYNKITNLSPLIGLTNLRSVVLGGNPLTDYSPLYGRTNLVNLWLHRNSITNAGFVAQLPWLNHLNLDQNQIADLTPLRALTNLTGLGLSGNPIAHYLELIRLTNLTSLRLEGNCLGAAEVASFLPGLTRLAFLDLNHNRLADLTPLTALPGLQALYLHRNRLENIQALTNLPRLVTVDLSQNPLDVSPGAPTLSVIYAFQCRMSATDGCGGGSPAGGGESLPCGPVNIKWQPVDQPPTLSVPELSTLPVWPIPANANSSLTIHVADDADWDDPPACSPVVVTAVSSAPEAIWVVNNPLPGTNQTRTLTVRATNPTGTSGLITLTVTDAAGLTNNLAIPMTSVPELGILTLCSNLDPALVTALRSATRKYDEEITTVDLLRLTDLSVYNPALGDTCLWRWLTNLTRLYLYGESVSNLTLVTHLPRLNTLGLDNTRVTDLSPLSALPHLASLSLSWNSVTNRQLVFPGVSSLTALHISGCALPSLSFLQALPQLTSLSLQNMRLTTVSALASLTNLHYFSIRQNLLEDLAPLATLSALRSLDLRLNLLDLSDESPTREIVEDLQTRGTMVMVWPQREPPVIDVRHQWIINAGVTSSLLFRVWDNAGDSDFVLGCSSDDPLVLPTLSLTLMTNAVWNLSVTAAAGLTSGTPARITIAAANAFGLSNRATVQAVVTEFLPLDGTVLNDSNMHWVSTGDLPWFGQTLVTHDGVAAAQSGAIGDGQKSELATILRGPGTITFWWKISSETNYDFLHLLVDGKMVLSPISGEVDWQQQRVSVPPGIHTVVWRYSKDKDSSVGLDAAWLDEVEFVPGLRLELVGILPNGVRHLRVYGPAGEMCELQAATNLWAGDSNWVSLGFVTATTTGTSFYDSNALTAVRFYRVRQVAAPRLTASFQDNLISIAVPTVPELLYQLECAGNLTDPIWFVVTNRPGDGEVMVWTDLVAAVEQRYYRVQIKEAPR